MSCCLCLLWLLVNWLRNVHANLWAAAEVKLTTASKIMVHSKILVQQDKRGECVEEGGNRWNQDKMSHLK